MKKTLILLFLSLSNISLLPGQNLLRPSAGHQEEVFIHYNAPLLLTGESLYYTFYNLNRETGGLSSLSRVGYVELIDRDKKVVFKHHLDLKAGQGQGDYLIPTSVPTGNYKLIGYTRWMLNDGENNFFSANVTVINPYLEEQPVIFRNESTQVTGSSPEKVVQKKLGQPLESQNFRLSTNKPEYAPRSKVQISLLNLNVAASGNLSVSVRKKEELIPDNPVNSLNYKEHYPDNQSGSVQYLPDLRGRLITGRIFSKTGDLSTAPRRLAFSMPGEDFFLRIVETKNDGRFTFNLENKNYNSTAFIQVLGDDGDQYQIKLDSQPGVDYGAVSIDDLDLSPALREIIKDISIYNQIENSYFDVKQDSVLREERNLPFYGNLPEVYNLDDYTRFPTVRETFIEIIKLARVRRDGRRGLQFDLTGNLAGNPENLTPLLLVDGLVVQDHGALIDFDARKIQSIGLYRQKYFLGSRVFQGIIAVETIAGDFYEFFKNDYLTTVEMQGFEEVKTYYSPNYSGPQNENDRIPDYRLQLLWLPSLPILNSETAVDFYTSDVPGTYEVSVEGFTNTGEPVSLRETFTVR